MPIWIAVVFLVLVVPAVGFMFWASLKGLKGSRAMAHEQWQKLSTTQRRQCRHVLHVALAMWVGILGAGFLIGWLGSGNLVIGAGTAVAANVLVGIGAPALASQLRKRNEVSKPAG
jgi:hypothetical protein